MKQCKHPDGCLRKMNSHGWCGMHGLRIQKSGSPGPVGAIDRTAGALDRFMAATKRDPQSGCLLWTMATDADGYGVFSVGNKSFRAHRWIFREKYGYLPEVVRHGCDTPACVDWERCLIGGTTADNVADRVSRNRQARGDSIGTSKLTAAEVQDIRTEYPKGILSLGLLADVYGVSVSQVHRIVRQESWGYL